MKFEIKLDGFTRGYYIPPIIDRFEAKDDLNALELVAANPTNPGEPGIDVQKVSGDPQEWLWNNGNFDEIFPLWIKNLESGKIIFDIRKVCPEFVEDSIDFAKESISGDFSGESGPATEYPSYVKGGKFNEQDFLSTNIQPAEIGVDSISRKSSNNISSRFRFSENKVSDNFDLRKFLIENKCTHTGKVLARSRYKNNLLY